MSIRLAVIIDAFAVADIKVRAWRSAYAGFLSREILDALDLADEAADWAEYLADVPGEHRLWVADDGAAVRGFCRTGPADDDPDLGPKAGEVYGLYIEPGLIGQGLGRELFAHAVADLEHRGYEPICLYTYEFNGDAMRFYQKHGFVLDGTTRLDEEDDTGVDEWRMTKMW